MYNDVYCSGAKSRLRYKKSTRRRRKNLGKNNQQKPIKQFQRFGIRKFTQGVASVMIASGMFFLAGGSVSANEVTPTATNPTTEAKVEKTDAADKKETVKVEKNEAVDKKEPATVEKTNTADKKETATEVKLDKSQLESYVKEITENIEAGKYDGKTEESVKLLKEDLASAKSTLDLAKTQDELKAAYNKLVTTVNSKLKNKPVEKKETPAVDTTNRQPTVGKKAENTEKKSDSNSIENTGSRDERNGKKIEKTESDTRSAGEGYTDKTEAKSAENGEFTATSTGKTYELLDGNEAYRLYVHGYQAENSEIKGKTSPPAAQGGRTDLPLSSKEAKKLSEEAPMWSGKIRPTGKAIGTGTYGSGGAYEFIATEIYGYNYDQGNHYAYIKNVTKRFSLSPEATAAGYSITNVEVSNLIPGLAYNKNTDSVEGYVSASIQNGVYDFRYDVTVTKPDGTTTKVSIKDLKAGWMGWQDTTAPRVAGDSTVVTVGDTISHDLKYLDNDGFANDTRANYKMKGQPIVPGKKASGKVTFTGLDGTELTSMNSFVINQPHLVVNGQYMTSKKPISNTIPGLTFDPTKNLLEGKASDAGIYTLAVLAKDFNNATNSKNPQWTANGQETHESVTIAVAPKITVKNVEAYAKEVDVTISKGANTGEIRMPDGTVTKFAVKDGKWVVAEGTTNSAVAVGTELGAASETADSTFKLAVTSDSTKYVGVDNIAAKASTDKVKANLQREVVTVRDKDGNSYTATLNAATGKYAIPDDKAYELVNNGDGTSTLTERRVYTEAQPDGAINYIVYEFKRVWTAESNAATLVDRVAEVRKKGEVKQVVSVDRTITELPFKQVAGTDGVTVQVTYDSVSKQWAASDGSKVTATKTNAGWSLETSSGFRGYVAFREATGTQLSSIQNAKPTGTSTSYSEAKDATVDLIDSEKASVGFKDKIDDKSDNPVSDTIKTKLTVTAPDGTQKVFDAAQAQEDAYIAAQRTAAAKTQAAAAAVKNEQDSINDLARQQEIVDRETKYVANAEEALNKLKLRTVSPTAQELAEQLLADARARLAKETEELRRQEAELPGITAKVAATRQEALDAEAAVETARTALKTAAEANLANAKQYVLSQVGRYKVTVRDVDSNGVVTTPTVGGTDSGEVTEDAVAETTYYIVVTEPKKTSGVKNEPQSTSMEEALKAGQPAGATVSDYKLVDPVTGKKSTSVTTDEGTYSVNPTTGEVTFTPKEGFVGNATPVTVEGNVTFNDEAGNPVKVPVSNTYTPTVYGLDKQDDESTGKQGQSQNSITGAERFSKLNDTDNTPDGTNVDMNTAKYSLEGANPEGKVVVDGEGTYSIDPATGVVTFEPLPTFKGKAQGVTVKVTAKATDASGKELEVAEKATYTPEVEEVTPIATPKETSGKQGQPQTQDATTMFEKGDETAPIDNTTIKLVDPSGAEVTSLPAMKDGKQVGTYTLDPATGVITFQPNPDFTGTPEPAKVTAADKNGTKVTTTYTPTVTPVTPTATPKKSSGKQGQPQKKNAQKMFHKGDDTAPIDNTTIKLVDPTTNAEVTSLPAMKDGKQVGTYTLDPATGEITFQPNPDFTGTPEPAKVIAADKNGTKVTTTYTPTVTPVEPTGTPVTSEGKQGQPQTGKPTFTEGDPTAPITITEDQPAQFIDPATGEATEATEIPAKDEKGNTVGKYTIDPLTGVVTFTPNKDFTGTPVPAKVEVKDANGTPTTATYTPTVTPVKPTGEDVTSSGKQGQPQEGTPKFTQGDEVAPITINEEQPAKFVVNGQPVDDKEIPATKDGKEIGKYKIDPLTGVVTFTPNKDFTGTPDPVTVEVKDANGTPTTGNYTPTVTPVVPTATPKETSGKQAQPQKQDTETMFTKGDEVAPIDKSTVKLVDPSGNEVTTLPATKDGKEVGTYTIDPTTGVITFQPNKDFVGTPDPVKVVAKDTNGTKVETTYTPTVTPVTPTAEPKETTGIQGATQEGTPTFTQGDETAPITITPEQPAQFVVDGKPVTDTTIPATKDGKQIGTYTIDPTTGKVTFTPNKDFVGTPDPATVQVKDKNGTPTSAKYTPTVTPVTPTAEPKETTDIQGKEQTGKPTFTPGNPEVPMDDEVPATFEDGTTEKVVPGEGTYKVSPDGIVTFTPEKTFTGTAKGVTVKRVDKNGTPVTAKYTPTVTPVTPEGTPAESTGIQGAKQEGTPEFKPGNPNVPIDETVAPTFEDGTTEKKVPGEGTYTIDKDRKVTFTPEPQFTGTAKGVTVKRVDKNGTPVTATYTPTVTPVVPVGTPVETTGLQGVKQVGTPEFKPGNPNVPIDETVAPTFEDGTTEKKVPGEGTYTIDKDGKVTFTPEPQFLGTAQGVTVKRVDKNGTPVTAKYTPTVNPVTPTGEPVKTINKKGETQTGTPKFTPADPNVPIDEKVPATFEDGSTEKVVPGEGKYTVDKDGKVTFTPEPNFVGKAKGVAVRRVDTNGNPITSMYLPVVTPELPEANPAFSSDYQGKTQTGKPTFVPGSPNTPIDETVPATFEDGSTEKVVPGEGTYTVAPDGTVTFVPEKDFIGTASGVLVVRVDKEGNLAYGAYIPTVLPTPSVPETPYTPTPTKPVTDKVLTTYVDENGELIIPDENGSHPGKSLEGYEIVRTEKDEKGNVRNIYRKATPTTPQKEVKTTFVDENGQVVNPEEQGSNPSKDLSGYELVRTEKDANGNVRHVYRKVAKQTPASPAKVARQELPQTGTGSEFAIFGAAATAILAGLGMVAPTKKDEE